MNHLSYSVEGCGFGAIEIKDVEPAATSTLYKAPLDTNWGLTGIPYAGRDYAFKDQLYYVGDGSQAQIKFTLQVMDIRRDITKTKDFATTFNIVDCSTLSNEIKIKKDKDYHEFLKTGGVGEEYTSLKFDEWFTFSVPHCWAKRYIIS